MYFSLQKPMNNTATYLLIQWLVQEFCINFAIFPNLCTPMCIFSAFFYQICTSCFSACLRIAKLPFYSSAGVGEGWSAAHKNFRLLLLPSGPDKVHKFALRRTQPSTPLTWGRLHKANPRTSINPAIADCRLQGTATSPSSMTIVYFSMLSPYKSSVRHFFL